jgi:hypothetical protein
MIEWSDHCDFPELLLTEGLEWYGYAILASLEMIMIRWIHID